MRLPCEVDLVSFQPGADVLFSVFSCYSQTKVGIPNSRFLLKDASISPVCWIFIGMSGVSLEDTDGEGRTPCWIHAFGLYHAGRIDMNRLSLVMCVRCRQTVVASRLYRQPTGLRIRYQKSRTNLWTEDTTKPTVEQLWVHHHYAVLLLVLAIDR